jgi:hypothetical protein
MGAQIRAVIYCVKYALLNSHTALQSTSVTDDVEGEQVQKIWNPRYDWTINLQRILDVTIRGTMSLSRKKNKRGTMSLELQKLWLAPQKLIDKPKC